MKERFHPWTYLVLRKAGWQAGRKIDLAPWSEWLDQFDSQAVHAARPFLEEFGNLEIWTISDMRAFRYLPFFRWLGAGPCLAIEPDDALRRDDIRRFEQIRGPLCPIGLDPGNVLFHCFVMACSQRVYFVTEDDRPAYERMKIYYLAENGDRLLDLLVEGLYPICPERIVGYAPALRG